MLTKTGFYQKSIKNRLISYFLMASLIMMMLSGAAKAAGLVTISPKQAYTLIQQERDNPDFVILDIRTPAEFKAGHIEGATRIDYYSKEFLNQMQALDKNKTYLIYCRSANRTTRTLYLIKDMGFEAVYNMGQGIRGWLQNGFPVVK
jgi:rhodanese-related sulfurtransferase